jgi:hypothetical protein
MKKIIIKSFILFGLLSNFTSKKIIEIKNLNEVENIIIKELKIDKSDKNTIILLDSRILFYYEKSDYKKTDNKLNKKDYVKKKKSPILKNKEYKEIVENLILKLNNFYILKTGFQEEIKLINNTYEVFYLPIRQKQQEKDPVIIGKIIFDAFIRPEVIIYLINLYKKIQIKKIIYITNNKNINFDFSNKEEVVTIFLPKENIQNFKK